MLSFEEVATIHTWRVGAYEIYSQPILINLPWFDNDDEQRSNPKLRWRHTVRDGGLNHQPHDCLLKRLFRRRSKETSKLPVIGLCVYGEFPAQRASNAEDVSISWRHYERWPPGHTIITGQNSRDNHGNILWYMCNNRYMIYTILIRERKELDEDVGHMTSGWAICAWPWSRW